ncbi:MAG TPA: MgtC/SapB family protein [Candidatus Omnitrophica bacterium]|nr:MgtC/SapB family protein [Candidatus Omnitrophota bacterium]
MPNFPSTFIRLFTSFILGSIIGLERERKARAAGLRTHILVCMGSCLIMLISLYIYELYKDKAPLDPARIAAGVVTGIGFLGAGTIIRSREGIRGLTTAASIWVSSAIGLAVGCGFISAALIVTLLTFLTLSYLRKVERKVTKDGGERK